MNKDFIYDVWLDSWRVLNDFVKFMACRFVVLLVCVDDINKCAAVFNVTHGVAFETVIAWEVNHVEFNIIVVTHQLCFYLDGGK